MYQRRERFKDLLKSNRRKILKIEKFLNNLEKEEKLNLKYSAFKMKNCLSFDNYNKIKNKNDNIDRVCSLKLIQRQSIKRLPDKKLNKENSKINGDKDIIDGNKYKIKKFKKPQLLWKFFDTNIKPIKKEENNKKVQTFFLKNNNEKNNKTKIKNLFFEAQSLSIDYNYRQKVFACADPHSEFKNECKYKTKEIYFLTPTKSKTMYDYNSEQKEDEKIMKIRNLKILKKMFLYDTGNFDIPLLSEDN